MGEVCLGQIVRAQILELVNDRPLKRDEKSRYRLKVKIIDGCLKGKTTYTAYKSVPKFSQDRILIRLEYPYSSIIDSQSEISLDSFVRYEGYRLAGYFLTSKVPEPFHVAGSKDVLLLARFKDWMKSRSTIQNEIEFRCNIPHGLKISKDALALMRFEEWIVHTSLIKNQKVTEYELSDLCRSISITHINENEIKIKYNVPDLPKLVSIYNPGGDIKWALHYYGDADYINAWELAWNNKPTISRKEISEGCDKGKIVMRGMNEAIRNYIDRMQQFDPFLDGSSPPMIISFDSGIVFKRKLLSVIKDAEELFSLKPPIMMEQQERGYN